MATSKCFPLIRGRAMRATRLDGCGRQVTTAGCNSIVTDGFVSVALSAVTEEGQSISVQNANGRVCVEDRPGSRFVGWGVVITFCNVDPELFSMLTGQSAVYDLNGIAVGFRVNSEVDPTDSAFALEIWSSVPGVACAPDQAQAQGSFGYTLLPYLQGGTLGDFTIENGAVTFTINNAQTKTGGGWGVGPYNVSPGLNGTPAKLLSPISSSDHLHVQLTSVAPPEPGCGCRIEPTSATAGTPGQYNPAGADDALNLADLADVIASPTTAWTTGQYVRLANGTTAHWSGSAWVAGPA